MNAHYDNAHLHVIHKIRAGNQHANPLPAAPEGRKLARVWTLINPELLAEIGPEHNRSAFMEDHIHDWHLDRDGNMRFYSRVVETNREVEVVLDYESMAERDARRARMTCNFDPATGKRLKP